MNGDMKQFIWSLFITLCYVCPSCLAQGRVEPIKYGDMDDWVDRQIKESSIIGGNLKHVYAIAPKQVITGNEPYSNLGGSPWGTSNVLAKVSGIVKTNTSVFPEKRGNGYCARLETRIERVKVMGVVNITVLAAGSVHLGSAVEPIRGAKNPQKYVNMGIPFTRKPVAIQFDYKAKLSGETNRVKISGFGKSTIAGKDYPAMVLYLQKRWEDENGNIYAQRIGTAVTYFENTEDWKNNATFNIMYGDITGDSMYNSNRMGLQNEKHGINSKGENVPVKEVAWGNADDVPTHLVLQFTSSHGGAFIGSPGNTLWVDNVKLIF